MEFAFTCLLDLKCRTGESPVYDERTDTLYFVDIPAFKLYAYGVETKELRSWDFDREVACVGLTEGSDLIVALRDRIVLFDPATERREVLCEIEQDQPATRCNDGKVGPDGAFWIATMDDRKDKEPIGSLYRVTSGGRVEKKVEGYQIPNGIAWTPDGEWMFNTDTRGPWIDRWRFDRRTGDLSDRTRIAVLDNPTGRPDGGACDARGSYWSAGVSAGRINHFNRDGELLGFHPLPAVGPTMPCFGGPDFHTLFVTSLREGRDPEQLQKLPLSGGLFAARSETPGFPAWRFLL
ncbi:Sugar lactone lactonase YvrE [Faunimonas pinastri]|uniref:Sugar lactone lactonase YvrE n=1 Tax=Faunimonas pinastri TaxID=1855383 RepID=A0A1H9LVT8_9HYPH|nr:SMP-30/gluconolactonase/LRE family protein [Faunimonas pinastri]SER15556.1 Sugar lactone lactonase YvrE [Faunimonas pinastri]